MSRPQYRKRSQGQLNAEFPHMSALTCAAAFRTCKMNLHRARESLRAQSTEGMRVPDYNNVLKPPLILKKDEFEKKQKQFREEIDKIYDKIFVVTEKVKKELEDRIMEMVKEWNRENRKARNYYDFHGLNREQAKIYAQELMEEARKLGTSVLRFETGNGNKSRNNVCVIRETLFEELGQMKGVRVDLEVANGGVLVVTM